MLTPQEAFARLKKENIIIDVDIVWSFRSIGNGYAIMQSVKNNNLLMPIFYRPFYIKL
jgi:hypothetical protein